jgi:hypothetical protein
VVELAHIAAVASRENVSNCVRAAFAAWDEVLNNELVTAAAECALVVKVGKAYIYVPRA